MNTDPSPNMFRRFSYLHLRRLLYLHDELSFLEERLDEADYAEKIATNPMSRRFDSNQERQQVMTEIKAKLNEYGMLSIDVSLTRCSNEHVGEDKCLKNYHIIYNFKSATQRHIGTFRGWYNSQNPVVGQEANLFRDPNDLFEMKLDHSDHASLQETITRLAVNTTKYTWAKWVGFLYLKLAVNLG